MNDVLRETLARRAHAVDPPGVDVESLVARAEKHLRRRRVGAVAGSILGVALVLAVPAALVDLRDEPRSVEQPKPPAPPKQDPKQDKDIAAQRPLVYAEGSILHVGSEEIDTGFTPAYSPISAGAVGSPDGVKFSGKGDRIPASKVMNDLYVTDDGAVFTTYDGQIWFSDGTSVQHIGGVPGKDQLREGALADSCGNCTSPGAIESDDSGSRVAWLEHASGGRHELVVFDTAERAVRTRLTLPLLPRAYGFLEDMYGDHVYWTRYPWRGGSRSQLMRTTVSTSTHHRATQRMLAAERQGKARLVVGRGPEAAGVTPRDEQSFQALGSRLEPVRFDHDVTNANYFVPVFHPVTGERLHFRAPAGLEKTNELVLFEWLDDDRFVLSTAPRWTTGERRDIVVCRISTEQCKITVRKNPGNWLGLPKVGFPG